MRCLVEKQFALLCHGCHRSALNERSRGAKSGRVAEARGTCSPARGSGYGTSCDNAHGSGSARTRGCGSARGSGCGSTRGSARTRGSATGYSSASASAYGRALGSGSGYGSAHGIRGRRFCARTLRESDEREAQQRHPC